MPSNRSLSLTCNGWHAKEYKYKVVDAAPAIKEVAELETYVFVVRKRFGKSIHP